MPTRASELREQILKLVSEYSEVAFETKGSGDFTRVATPLLQRAAAERWDAETFLKEVRRTFPPDSRQNPDLMPGCNPQQRLLPGPDLLPIQSRDTELVRIAALLEQAALGLRTIKG